MLHQNSFYYLFIWWNIKVALIILLLYVCVEGLAVDWRDGNIYWCSGFDAGRISVLSQTTTDVRVLIDDDLQNPKALTVVPQQKFIIYCLRCPIS